MWNLDIVGREKMIMDKKNSTLYLISFQFPLQKTILQWRRSNGKEDTITHGVATIWNYRIHLSWN